MLASMETRLLIVDGSIDPSVYRPVDQWARFLRGTPFDVMRPPAGDVAPDLDAFTHVLVTGSEASLLDPEPWFDAEA